MLPSADPRVAYIGNNSTGTYPWTWLVYEASDLHVAVLSNASPQVLTVLTLGTDYTIQNPELQLNNSNGGNIVLTSSGFFAFNNGILPTGWAMVIRRAVTFGQDTTLDSQGLYDPASIEGALDFLAMQTIQLQDALARVVQMPLDDYVQPAQNVHVASVRANNYLAFDAAGNPMDTPGQPPTIPTSIIGAGVLQAATSLAAVTALGIGGLLGGMPICTTSTIGITTSSYTLEYYQGPQAGLSPQQGTIILFNPPATNVGGTTFTWNGVTSIVHTKAGAGLSNGDLTTETFYLLAYDGYSWRLMV